MGLTLAARRAGTNAASAATTSSTPATATAVAGSVGLTSYKNDAIVRVVPARSAGGREEAWEEALTPRGLAHVSI